MSKRVFSKFNLMLSNFKSMLNAFYMQMPFHLEIAHYISNKQKVLYPRAEKYHSKLGG